MASEATQLTSHQDMGTISSGPAILILDDNAFDLKRLIRLVRATDLNGFLVSCSTIADMEDALAIYDFDVALVDNRLGTHCGEDARRIIDAHAVDHPIPTIMVTGASDTAETSGRAQSGFQAILDKSSLDPARLETAILGAITAPETRHGLSHAQRSALTDPGLTNGQNGSSATAERIFEQAYRLRKSVAEQEMPDPKAISYLADEITNLRSLLEQVDAGD